MPAVRRDLAGVGSGRSAIEAPALRHACSDGTDRVDPGRGRTGQREDAAFHTGRPRNAGVPWRAGCVDGVYADREPEWMRPTRAGACGAMTASQAGAKAR